jgi:hypothetical protein
MPKLLLRPVRKLTLCPFTRPVALSPGFDGELPKIELPPSTVITTEAGLTVSKPALLKAKV